MPGRSQMKHRATVLRDQQETRDGWNQKATPDWETHIASLPCFAWYTPGREVQDGQKIANVDAIGLLVPNGTDVTPQDRIGDITDRQGRVLYPGPHRIESVGRRQGHISLTLEVI